MATTNRIQFPLARKKNLNRKSTAYNKWYLVRAYAKNLSQRGLIDHMVEHGLSVPRAIIEAVLTQIAQCVPELCATGVGVQLDGLGIFYPSIKSSGDLDEEECTTTACLEGVRVRFKPDSTKLDNLTSKVFKEKVQPEIVGYVANAGTEDKPKKIVIPYGAQLAPDEDPEP